MRKVAFEISDNSIQASSSYAGPSVYTITQFGIKQHQSSTVFDSVYLTTVILLAEFNSHDVSIIFTQN